MPTAANQPEPDPEDLTPEEQQSDPAANHPDHHAENPEDQADA